MTIVRPSICQTPDGKFLATVQVDTMGTGPRTGTRNRGARVDTAEAGYEFIIKSLVGLLQGDERPVIEIEGTSYPDIDSALAALRARGIHPCGETRR